MSHLREYSCYGNLAQKPDAVPSSECLGRSRFLRSEEPEKDICQESETETESYYDPDNADENGIEPEILSKTAADAGEHSIGP